LTCLQPILAVAFWRENVAVKPQAVTVRYEDGHPVPINGHTFSDAREDLMRGVPLTTAPRKYRLSPGHRSIADTELPRRAAIDADREHGLLGPVLSCAGFGDSSWRLEPSPRT
jgi:hypothetical protein